MYIFIIVKSEEKLCFMVIIFKFLKYEFDSQFLTNNELFKRYYFYYLFYKFLLSKIYSNLSDLKIYQELKFIKHI